ncbi:MAG: hypothetical protein AB7S66_09390 [Sphaerochaeta sp.]|uniref:hypothetical protein n=1 Tax=Sphaerochaeta sp. TaxID=1972642 RepID=UPI003D0F9F0F
MNATKLSGLPQIEVLLGESSLSRYIAVMSRPLVADTIRVVLESIRGEVMEKGKNVPDRESILSRICLECEHISKDRIQRVINATGVIIHTNMGRSPLNCQI